MGDLVHLRPSASDVAVPAAGYEMGAIPGGVWSLCDGIEGWWTPGDAEAFAALLTAIDHPHARAMRAQLLHFAAVAERLEGESDD